MSRRKIAAILNKKGVKYDRIEYVRSCPTPSGFAKGWDIELHEDEEDRLFGLGCEGVSMYMEFDTLADVIEWANKLPLANDLEG